MMYHVTVAGVSLVALANGHQLRAEPTKEGGVEVGSMLRNAHRHLVADVSNQKENVFLDGLVRQLQEKMPSDEHVLVNDQVSEVVAKGNKLADEGRIEPDAICSRNWNHPCPSGWMAFGGRDCIAPPSYQGACGHLQSFEGATPFDKNKFAEDCQVQWPCLDECSEGRDYGQACPQDWEDSHDGFCVAARKVTKPSHCAELYKFDDMSAGEKEAIAFACGLKWPCKLPCVQDYSQACPQEWQESSQGNCVAPETYAGKCDYVVNMKGASADQKRAFAEKCFVQFPCS
jgi:CPW-WPC domain-containing protein